MSRFSQYQETMKDAVYKCVDGILKTKMMYQPENTQTWNNQICEKSIAALKGITDQYKYAVTCVIIEYAGAGMALDSSTYWDPETDGSVLVTWNNPAILCFVTVFAISY